MLRVHYKGEVSERSEPLAG